MAVRDQQLKEKAKDKAKKEGDELEDKPLP
jgi:hypothetical protein